jgi:hypothetical protein
MPVYVFPLVLESFHEKGGSVGVFRPMPISFTAKYNGYGGGYDCTGTGLPVVLESLRQKIEECTYHDITVSRDSFDEKTFFKAAHENQLVIDHLGKKRSVDFTMCRKDVVDNILENRKITKFVGEGMGNCGHNNSYISYSFSDVLKDIPSFIAEMKENYVEKFEPKIAKAVLHMGLHCVYENCDLNKACEFIIVAFHQYAFAREIEAQIIELVLNNEIDAARSLMTEYVKFNFINSFMESVRKSWHPDLFMGSQDCDMNEYILLNNSIKNSIEKNTSYVDEDGDDEE